MAFFKGAGIASAKAGVPTEIPKESDSPQGSITSTPEVISPEKGSKGKKDKVETEAPVTLEGKLKAATELAKVLGGDKEFGAGILMRLGDRVGLPVPHVPTNLVSMDMHVWGCGGAPRGRIIEIFGPESAGKTTISLDIVASFQKAGNVAGFIDAEHALDPNYASLLGVDVANLFISQPDNGEQALQVTERLIESGLFGILVVDSVAALVPRAELAGEIGDTNVGLQARMMSQALRMLTGKCNKFGVTLIFINQIREKIGVMFGNPETTTGGRALKFFASVRLDVRKTKMLLEGGKVKEYGSTDKGQPVGHVIKVKNIKNKVATPLKDTELHHYYETGLDRVYDMMSFADSNGIFKKRGSWIDFVVIAHDEETGKEEETVVTLGNGVVAATAFIKDNPAIQGQIRAALWAKLRPAPAALPETVND